MQRTPAAAAARLTTARDFCASLLLSLRYSSNGYVVMTGSTATMWKLGVAMKPVTLAPSDRASFTPTLIALSESFEPSVGIRMCLYMIVLSVADWRHGP